MRRSWKRLLLPVIGAGLVLVGGLALFLDARGGFVTALAIPPTRDYSTPASQNGFTLLAVQRPEDQIGNFHFTPPMAGPYVSLTEEKWAGGENHPVAGLWIRLPDGSGSPTTFRVTGHAASGQDFPLTASYPSGGGRGGLLFTSLPGCYAGSLTYIDVTVSDGRTLRARWRISRLPAMRHVITAPVRVAETFSAAGAKLELRATRRQGKHGQYVLCQMFPSIAPGSHQWEFRWRGDSPETDWMPYDAETAETTSMILTDAETKQVIAFNHGAAIYEFIQHPYVGEDRFVRIQGHLTQFETHDEKVTFHNVQISEEFNSPIFTVTRRQSVTTPSGIRVTLPVQSKATFMHQGILEDAGLIVDVQPHDEQNRLPNSPLGIQYNRQVAISMRSVKPFGFLGESLGPASTHKLMLFVPPSELTTGSKAKDLTLIARQRVDLQTFPVTLTAPIHDQTASHTL